MNVDTIDCLLVHDLIENLLGMGLDATQLQERVAACFGFLEEMVQEGKIRSYGISSSTAFLMDPVTLSIQENVPASAFQVFQLQSLLKAVEQTCGRNNHFKFLQAPFSMMQNQAWTLNYQDAHEKISDEVSKSLEDQNLLDICHIYGINFIAHKSLGGYGNTFLPKIDRKEVKLVGLKPRHLQLFKSAIGSVFPESVKGIAIGMSDPDHVIENLEVLTLPNCDKDVTNKYIGRERLM